MSLDIWPWLFGAALAVMVIAGVLWLGDDDDDGA